MDLPRLRQLLERVRDGSASVDDAASELRALPFADLGYATVDHHRALRQGVPEVVLGQGKTAEQIIGISRELATSGQNVLVTRIDGEKAKALVAAIPGFRHVELPRLCILEQAPIPALAPKAGPVVLISAGTSDLPVAEECGETLRLLGGRIERVYDVGVAGIHRLLHKRETLERASVVVVVAGMEGALPSVVGGLVRVPVIAVPTSVGYGAALEGFTALMCMLTSCASGITVVNIDNGFGAAFATARILRGGE
ncbi:MAG: nickel pincer cofactor biosynthesis protein LarB [Myxococcales bacterium]|nr:nickel pincer cofactor biosynthesis protein LarB [Myxococcales bacterium]